MGKGALPPPPVSFLNKGKGGGKPGWMGKKTLTIFSFPNQGGLGKEKEKTKTKKNLPK